MPKWGMWYIVWGEGVFCRSLPFPRQRLHVPCLFPNLALPRVDSPSGLASQTWPCHILQSRSLSGRHVSTGFLDPVLGAMMKQVCWHARRSKAYRGLPEARMAGATVEETAFEDVNRWQAPVSQKPPLMGT